MFGEAGYTGAGKRAQAWPKVLIAAKRSVVKAIDDPPLHELTEQLAHAKASIRAVGSIRSGTQGAVRLREGALYKGLAKNGAQVTTLFALVSP
jgi:IS5 family transposase